MTQRLERLAREARAKRHTLRLDVATGHTLLLDIRAVGAGWVSGETREGPKRGALVVWRSVCAVWSGALGDETGETVDPPENTAVPGFDVPLRELARLAKPVTLYASKTSWRGRILWAGDDCAGLRRLDGVSVVVPYTSMCWIAVE